MASYLGGSAGGFDPQSYMMRKLMDDLFKDKTPERQQQTVNMQSLIAAASSEEGLLAAEKAFRTFDKQNDKWGDQFDEMGDVLGANLNAKRAEFNKYKSALSQAQDYYKTGELTKEKVMTWDIDKFSDLSREVAKIGEINDIIKAGSAKFSYSIPYGQSNEMLSRDMTSRFSQINAGIKSLAQTGSIPEQLVFPILSGDWEEVEEEITENRSRVETQLRSAKGFLTTLDKMELRAGELNGTVMPSADDTFDDDELAQITQWGGGKTKFNLEELQRIKTSLLGGVINEQSVNGRIPALEESYKQWTGNYYTEKTGTVLAPEVIGDYLKDEGLVYSPLHEPVEATGDFPEPEPVEEGELGPYFPSEDKDVSVKGITSSDWKSTAVALGGFAALSQSDRIERGIDIATKNVAKASRYIYSASKLSASQITEFLEAKSVKNTLNNIKSLEAKMASLKEDGKIGTAAYKRAKKKLDQTMKYRSSYWSKKFGVKKEDINKLWKTKDRWDIFRFKSDLKNKYPKLAKDIFSGKVMPKFVGTARTVGKLGRTYLPYKIGDIVAGAVGAEGIEGVGVTLGTAVGVQQASKKFWPKAMSLAKTSKGRKFLMKTFGKTIGKKIIQGAATGKHPVLAAILGGAGAIWGGIDAYNAIKDYSE